MTIDGPAPEPPDPVALRLVTTYADDTRRIDVVLGGVDSTWVEHGVATTFPTTALWPTLRELLPPLEVLRARPQGLPAPAPRAPGPTFVADCLAHVSIATVVDDAVAVRTWLATADQLWSVTPLTDATNDVRPAADGALADLLVWDVTGALEAVVRRLRSAS